MASEKSRVLRQVHVNVPFCMLIESYLEFVLKHRINPEIGLDARALDSVEFPIFKRYAEALLENGAAVTFHGPFADLSPGSVDPEIRVASRRRFEQVLRLVPLFRPKTVVCHAGYEEFRYGYMKKEWTENSLEMWLWFSKELSAAGSRLVLENVFEKSPNDLLPLFEVLGPEGVGFCLDVGHCSVFSGASLEKWLDVLGPFLHQLHLHDNHGDADSHLPLGSGSIDFDFLFDYLRQGGGMRPLITLEPHVDEDLWPSLSYLEGHWPWDRGESA